jgi:hypothetical protein
MTSSSYNSEDYFDPELTGSFLSDLGEFVSQIPSNSSSSSSNNSQVESFSGVEPSAVVIPSPAGEVGHSKVPRCEGCSFKHYVKLFCQTCQELFCDRCFKNVHCTAKLKLHTSTKYIPPLQSSRYVMLIFLYHRFFLYHRLRFC